MSSTKNEQLSEIVQWLDDNYKSIHCQLLAPADLFFSAMAAIQNWEPGGGAASWYYINRAAMSAAALYGCIIEDPKLEDNVPVSTKKCTCVTNGGQLIAEVDAGLGAKQIREWGSDWTTYEILNVWYEGGTSYCQARTEFGGIQTHEEYRLQEYESFAVDWYIVPQNGGACCGRKPDPIPPPPTPGPITHTTPDECEWSVEVIDAYVDKNGYLWNKYKVSANLSPCGGDFCYWESPTGPIYDESCTMGPPEGPGVDSSLCGCGLSAVTYTQNVGCTWNAEEQKYDMSFPWNVPQESNGILGLAKRLDAIAGMLDVAGLIPYRICNVKPELEGDWVTTRWISDEKSFESGRRLRKLLRYRSKSSRDLAELSRFWEDFEWRAGPVCVQHSGAWWGTPQVWAESEEEGRRVLRHVGGEAGIDPDQVGRWGTRSSRSPRYGMSGTMKILRKDGFPWVSSRDGPDWPNVLAQ